MRVEVWRAGGEDVGACVRVLQELPDHFTADTHDPAATGILGDTSWVACDGDDVIGFLVLQQRYVGSAEITFAAVRPSAQGRGVGTAMVAVAIGRALSLSLRAIEVKTLDASSGYEPYVATRAFWARQGFVQIDTIDPLPGWQPGNPCAIDVLPLT